MDADHALKIAIRDNDHLGITDALKRMDGNPVDILRQSKLSQDNLDALLQQKAAGGGTANMVRVYVEAGADVLAKGQEGKTALHVAAVEGHTDTVRALIKSAGSKQKEMLNAQTSNGDTAAHLAARAGHPDVVHVLSRAGADMKIKNHAGQNVIEQAEAEVQKHMDAIERQDAVLRAAGSHLQGSIDPRAQIRTVSTSWGNRVAAGNGHAESVEVIHR